MSVFSRVICSFDCWFTFLVVVSLFLPCLFVCFPVRLVVYLCDCLFISCLGSFLLTTLPQTHTIKDMRKSKRRNRLNHTRVNLSQPEKSSLPRGGGELTEKTPCLFVQLLFGLFLCFFLFSCSLVCFHGCLFVCLFVSLTVCSFVCLFFSLPICFLVFSIARRFIHSIVCAAGCLLIVRLLIFWAILKIWKAKSSSRMGAFFLNPMFANWAGVNEPSSVFHVCESF